MCRTCIGTQLSSQHSTFLHAKHCVHILFGAWNFVHPGEERLHGDGTVAQYQAQLAAVFLEYFSAYAELRKLDFIVRRLGRDSAETSMLRRRAPHLQQASLDDGRRRRHSLFAICQATMASCESSFHLLAWCSRLVVSPDVANHDLIHKVFREKLAGREATTHPMIRSVW